MSDIDRSFNFLTPNGPFQDISFSTDDVPEWAGNINKPMSIEFNCTCSINERLFGKLIGIDLSKKPDMTCSSVIYTTSKLVQVRRSKKKRINKKWAKRYGYKRVSNTYELENVIFEQHYGELYIISDGRRKIK